MKTIAVHADDFGLSLGTNEAIAELLDRGVIQSTTLLANGVAFEDALDRIKATSSQWAVGLHGNLTLGLPVGDPEPLRAILDETGRFRGRRALWKACRTGAVGAGAVYDELQAQWQKCIDFGLQPTHVDTHQHTHANPQVGRALIRLADQEGVPFRRLRLDRRLGGPARRLKSWLLNRSARKGEQAGGAHGLDNLELISIFQADEPPSVSAYQRLLENSTSTYIELMVHPARVDGAHERATDISDVSAMDYACLASEDWSRFLATLDAHWVPAHQLTRLAERAR